MQRIKQIELEALEFEARALKGGKRAGTVDQLPIVASSEHTSQTWDAMLGFGCCRPTWGPATPTGEASGRGPATCEQPDVHEMRRAGAETVPDHHYNYRGSARILKPAASYPPSTELARSKAPAPRSLLEASARRLAVSVSTSLADRGPQCQAADSALCLQFFNAYLDALKGANPRCAACVGGGSSSGDALPKPALRAASLWLLAAMHAGGPRRRPSRICLPPTAC